MERQTKKRIKVDKKTMKDANISFIIIIIILFILLTVGAIGIINPNVYDVIKASLGKLFN